MDCEAKWSAATLSCALLQHLLYDLNDAKWSNKDHLFCCAIFGLQNSDALDLSCYRFNFERPFMEVKV